MAGQELKDIFATVVKLQKPLRMITYPVTTDAIPNVERPLTLRGEPVWMILDNNLTGAKDITVSFDKGKTYKTIRAGAVLNLTPFTIPESIEEIWYKSSSASASFEVLAGERV